MISWRDFFIEKGFVVGIADYNSSPRPNGKPYNCGKNKNLEDMRLVKDVYDTTSALAKVKGVDINKIFNSIKLKKFLVYVLKFKNKIGNPIGFDISLIKKFKNIKGEFGAKFMVKRLKSRTKFIRISTAKSFKDFDKASDFRI